MTNNGAPVAGATIEASLLFPDGERREIKLLDHGSNDGAAGDGIYGTTIAKLPQGKYTLEATANTRSSRRMAIVNIDIGADVKPTKAKK